MLRDTTLGHSRGYYLRLNLAYKKKGYTGMHYMHAHYQKTLQRNFKSDTKIFLEIRKRTV